MKHWKRAFSAIGTLVVAAACNAKVLSFVPDDGGTGSGTPPSDAGPPWEATDSGPGATDGSSGAPTPDGSSGATGDGSSKGSGGRVLATIATGQQGANAIGVNASGVYWTICDELVGVPCPPSNVMSLPTGSTTPIVLAGDQSQPNGIAVTATHVYWTNTFGYVLEDGGLEEGGPANPPGSVTQISLATGSTTSIATGQQDPEFPTVDSTAIYWIDDDATVMKAPLDGGAVVTLATESAGSGGLAVDSTYIYWVDANAGTTISRMPLDGSAAPSLFATAQSGFEMGALAADGTSVYWAERDNAGTPTNSIRKQAATGGSPTSLVAGILNPGSIVVDAVNVYWVQYASNGDCTTSCDGAVLSVPVSGGPVTTLATEQAPGGLAVDSTSLYWPNFAQGTIMKLTPK